MSRNYFTTLLLFLVLVIGACDDDEINTLADPCTSRATVSNSNEAFTALINGKNWTPNSGGNASVYKGVLKINAGDSLNQSDTRTIINLTITNPLIGKNRIGNENRNSFLIHTIVDGNSNFGFTDCGTITLLVFDTVSNVVSGYFHGTNFGNNFNPSVDVSNGVFNLPITSLFCEPMYSVKDTITNLYKNWKLIGFFDKSDRIISPPPCYSAPSIRFDSINNTVDGYGSINAYGAELALLSNSTLELSNLYQTLAGGSIHSMDFEERYFQLLTTSNLSYSIEGNILTLINIKENTFLKFAFEE